jgi:IclR family acetate operon transcriptional repressor
LPYRQWHVKIDVAKRTMARTGKPAARRVGTVSRALAVLDAIAADGAEVGTNELARRTGINASTVSRLLATLADAGLVELVPGNGRYRLGVRLVQLGHAVVSRLDVRELGHPILQRLVEATGETATLSLGGEPDAVTVDFVRSPASVQGVAQLGRPSIGHATAAGKVLLAFGPVTPPSGPLRAYTERTITSRPALAAELDRVRAQGWAQATGEREPDLNALAAPVRAAGGELAAILGLQGPASRFDEEAMEASRGPLLDAAHELSAALGWQA